MLVDERKLALCKPKEMKGSYLMLVCPFNSVITPTLRARSVALSHEKLRAKFEKQFLEFLALPREKLWLSGDLFLKSKSLSQNEILHSKIKTALSCFAN